MIKRKLCLTGVCLGLAFLFLTAGGVYGKKAGDFSHMVTMLSDRGGIDANAIREIEKDTERETAFAAWKEIPDSQVSAKESGRMAQADTIMLYGASYCVLPYGKALDKEDTDGCVIGLGLAEKLFGSHFVEGQQLVYADRVLTVRGTIKEPENLLLYETSLTETESTFERLNLFCENFTDGRQAAEDFINRYGLDAEILRFDLYRDLSWMKEMIPGKWSDFSGWKENLEKKSEQKEQVGRVGKSCLETEYLHCLHVRNCCFVLGIVSAGIFFFFNIIMKKTTCSGIFVSGIWMPAKQE